MSATDPFDTAASGEKPVGPAWPKRPTVPFPFLDPPLRPDEIGRLEDFRVIRELGSGGMGLVFEAEQLSLRRRVALKVLRPELASDRDHRERFLREARAAAAITSDHVITIYHISEEGLPFFAMQFLEGESLEARLEGPNRITLRSALEVTRQAAAGLAAAHEQGLIHRDIKPSNLWLEAKPVLGKEGEEKPGVLRPRPTISRVKILDFGLARRGSDPSLTSTGFIVGTPHFMSPEQASGLELDSRSDLFSLGCVLYMMLTGEMPFPGRTAMAVMTALATKTPEPVHEKNPDVPRPVSDLVARLLEKDVARRLPSARELIARLDESLGELAVSTTLPAQRATTQALTRTGGETPLLSRAGTAPLAPTSTGSARPGRRWPSRTQFGLAFLVLLACVLGYRELRRQVPTVSEPEPIVVGILHSQSGTMAISEAPVIEATLLAIDEINAAGGVLGRPLKPVVVDGKSDPDVFARLADRLLTEDRAAVIFGCWTSASRKAVRDVLQRHPEGLLFYPVQYEGLEHSPRIVYLGPAPNQQLLPAVEFLTRPPPAGLGKKRLYLVGSDYVFPRAAHEIIRDRVAERARDGIRIVGESFLPLGSNNVAAVVADIQGSKADAIINTINGGTNVHFFGELRNRNVVPESVPTLSVSIAENEIQGLNPSTLAGDYIAASYLQSIDRSENRAFLRKLRERFPERVGSDAVAAAYGAVHLWAKAAAKAGTVEPNDVREACRGLEFDGPRARLRIDPDNLHAWLPVRIGRVLPDGRVELVAAAGSEAPIAPVPFPPTRTETQWTQFLQGLTARWDGKWQPPGAN
jgi:urea transport system substrate-binding protein